MQVDHPPPQRHPDGRTQCGVDVLHGPGRQPFSALCVDDGLHVSGRQLRECPPPYEGQQMSIYVDGVSLPGGVPLRWLYHVTQPCSEKRLDRHPFIGYGMPSFESERRLAQFRRGLGFGMPVDGLSDTVTVWAAGLYSRLPTATRAVGGPGPLH